MDLERNNLAGDPSQTPIKVLVCDDESLFREMLVTALDAEHTIDVVGAAASGSQAIKLARESSPDVVLMDIELGDGPNGIVIAGDIKHEFPQIGVVILSAHRDKEFLAGFIDEGVSGWSFLLKQSVSDIQSLVQTIESAASGQVTMDSSVIGELFPRQKSILERLTHGQLETLMFIASGYANSAIAEELTISEYLVEPLVKTIYHDLHIHENESVDQRVRATLLYLEETAQVSP